MPENDLVVPTSDSLPRPRAAGGDAAPVVGGEVTASRDTLLQITSGRQALLKANLRQASDQNPDRAARVQALASATRLPAGLVDRNLEDVEKDVRLSSVDTDRIQRENPNLAGWLSQPENAALAHDDLPVLQRLDHAVRQLTSDPGADPNGALPKGFTFGPGGTIYEAISLNGKPTGQAVVHKDLAAYEEAMQKRGDAVAIQGMQQERDAAALRDEFGAFANVAAGAAAGIDSTRRAFGTQNADDAHAADLATAASQQLSPGFFGDIQRGIGGVIADAPLMAAGGPLARGATSLLRISRARAVLAPLITERGARAVATGLTVAAANAPLAAREGITTGQQSGVANGVLAGLIETVVPAAFGRTGVERAIIPGLDPLVDGWRGAARHLLTDVGMEASEEATTELAHAIHEQVSGMNPNALDVGPLARRLAVAGAVGGLVSGSLNLPAVAGRKLEQDSRNLGQSMNEAHALGAALDTALASKTKERSSGALAALIQSHVDAATGGVGSTVYFQGDDWDQHFAAQGIDPAHAANLFGVDPAAYAAAKAGGAQIPVPLTGFLSKATAEDRVLLQRARLRPEGLSPDQIAITSDRMHQDLGAAVSDTAADASAQQSPEQASGDQVAQDVERQLVAAGTSPDAARQQAAVWRAGMVQLASRVNQGAAARGADPITPFDLYQRYALKIMRETPRVLRNGRKVDTLDALIDRLKSNDVPTDRQVNGPSLVEFLKNKGGIREYTDGKDNAGDLRSMDAHLTHGPGSGPLIRKEGLSLDQAREAAIAAGYDIPEDSINGLIDAIQGELGGTPVHAFGHGDENLASVRDAMAELSHILTQAGVDPAKAGHEDIRRVLEQKPSGTTLEQPAIAEGIDDAAPRTLEQPARGKLTIAPGRTLSIELMKKADLSTFLHETGHAYLEILTDLAADANAATDIVEDLAAIRRWLGNKGKAWTVDQHEQFARGFEAYLMEGRAPSQGLRAAFARFKGWLTTIYRSLSNLRVELTPEVRGVFDRILASEQEIEVAGQALGAAPVFATAKEMGISDAAFADYQRALNEAKASAADALRAELMHEEMQGIKQARARELRDVTAEVVATINARPEFVALRALQDGVVPEGAKLPADTVLKLDREDLVGLYGEQALKRLPGPRSAGETDKANAGRRVYATEGGMALQDAATLFGFRDGDQLWEALVNAPDHDGLVAHEADAEMRRRHPDPLTDGSLEESARAALADEMAGELLVAEVHALAARSGDRVAPSEVLRQVAREKIAGMRGRDLNPNIYQQASAKAAAEAFDAAARARSATPEAKAGLDREAFTAKQRQIFNLELYRAARDAKEAAEKGQTYIRSLDKLETRARIGKAGGWEFSVYDPDGSLVSVETSADDAKKHASERPGATYLRTNGYLEQIDAILEGYELRRVSVRQLRRREALASWIKRQTEAGEHVEIPDNVIADLGRRNWNDLTVAEQADVVDAIRSVDHLARFKSKLMKASKERKIEAARDALVTTIEANAKKKIVPRIGTTAPEAVADRFVRFFEDHRKDAFLAREMDGFQAGGPVWEYLIRPRTEAASAEAEQVIAAVTERDAVFKAWSKKAGVTRKDIPGTAMRLTAEQRIAMACNWGNAEGRQRVMMYVNQGGFDAFDVQAVLDSLDKADWDLVKATWKQINGHWSDIAALEQRTTGLVPEKVVGIPIETKHGIMPGGYYPLKYDQRLSNKAGDLQAATEAKSMMRAAGAAPQTKRGHTKQRSQKVEGLALRLDFGVVGEHLGEVIHDLTHREMLIDQNRLLRDPKISAAIIERYGRGALDQLVNTAVDIASGDRPGRAAADRFLKMLRQNSSAAVFGFNLTSAIMNVTGFLQSIPRVGGLRMASAVARVFRDAAHLEASTTWVEGKSSFMRTRSRTMLREMAEANRRVQATGAMDAVRRWGYFPMTQVQRATDLVTWIAAHDQAMEAGQKDGKTAEEADKDAVAIADQTVIDTQGSGRVGDLSAFQRGGEVSKLLTAFYSYFNVAYNLQREAVAGVRHDPKAISKWVQLGTTTMLVWIMPAYLSGLIGEWLRGDEDDPDKRTQKLLRQQAAYGLGMLVGLRELGGAVEGRFDYGGPAGARGLGALYQLVSSTGKLVDGKDGRHEASNWAKAALGTSGLFGIPAIEAQRLVDAWVLAEEKGEIGAALRIALFGKPHKK